MENNKKNLLIGFCIGLLPLIACFLISIEYNPNEKYMKYMLENDKECITYQEMQKVYNKEHNRK
jgi:hypothetical protein